VPIAVINFTNHTGDEQFDYLCAAIPNLLISNLEQSKHLSVLTWERMRDLLKILGKEEVQVVDEDLGFEICEMDDIQTVITGSFTKAGNMFVTDVKVLDVASKKILKTSSSQGEGVASILKIQIDELSQDISRNVSMYERVITPTKMRILEVTTNSMEAYNYFLRGKEEYEKWYFDEARKYLEKAVDIDSMFASAHLYLAVVYGWLNDWEGWENAYAKAKALSSKVTEKERLYIEASYARNIERNYEKRLRILQKLVAKYPKEKWAYVMLGDHYNIKGQTNKAIEELHKALELDPNYGDALCDIAFQYADIDDFDKANEFLKRYATVIPGHADPFDGMGNLYFKKGQLDEAIAQYQEALFIKSDFYVSIRSLVYIYALKEDYAEALKWIAHLIAEAPSLGVRADGYWQKAFYEFLLGGINQAWHDLSTAEDLLARTEYILGNALAAWLRAWIYYDQEALLLSRDYFNDCNDYLGQISSSNTISYNTIFYNFCLGLIEVKQQLFDSTKARLAVIKPLLPNVQPFYKNHAQFLHDLLYTEMLLACDSLEKSILVFEKTPPYEVLYPPAYTYTAMHMPYYKNVMARAYCKKGDIDRAIAEYEKLTDPDPNKRGRSLIIPLWRYELAKLYEQKGLKANAIAQYEKFLEIWKNADADRPELIDAKKRLAKLQAG
jgi:tetratricopeptide (TPR) repeat protein